MPWFAVLVGRSFPWAEIEQLLAALSFRRASPNAFRTCGPVRYCGVAMGRTVGLSTVGCVISPSPALG
jgi:hypothetical protein